MPPMEGARVKLQSQGHHGNFGPLPGRRRGAAGNVTYNSLRAGWNFSRAADTALIVARTHATAALEREHHPNSTAPVHMHFPRTDAG